MNTDTSGTPSLASHAAEPTFATQTETLWKKAEISFIAASSHGANDARNPRHLVKSSRS